MAHTRSLVRLSLILLAPLATTACGSGGGGAADAAPDAEWDCDFAPCRLPAGQFPADPIDQVDILFVIDDSGGMDEEQLALTYGFGSIAGPLYAQGPDVHIGVVSTNMGSGPFDLVGCEGDGGGGRLQSAPQGACAGPTDPFIIDEDDGMGGRRRNYDGSLDGVFSCIARLGTTGCGFEQPFAAARAALDGTVPENAGFLRPGALLAVVFLSDEDDCSVSDPAMFDPAQTDDADPLGAFSSFRCTEFGVTCDGGDLPRGPGFYQECAPRESAFMRDSADFADFLRALKPPGRLLVSTVVGRARPFNVVVDADGHPELDASCGNGTGREARPGIRFRGLRDELPTQSTDTSICEPDWSTIGGALDGVLGAGAGGAGGCLFRAIDDVDISPTPGLQVDCLVYDVTDLGLPGETRALIPTCGSPPCWHAEVDPLACQFGPQQLRLTVDRAAPPPAGTVIVAECMVPPLIGP